MGTTATTQARGAPTMEVCERCGKMFAPTSEYDGICEPCYAEECAEIRAEQLAESAWLRYAENPPVVDDPRSY